MALPVPDEFAFVGGSFSDHHWTLAGQRHLVAAVLALATVFVGRTVANAKTADQTQTTRLTGMPD